MVEGGQGTGQHYRTVGFRVNRVYHFGESRNWNFGNRELGYTFNMKERASIHREEVVLRICVNVCQYWK